VLGEVVKHREVLASIQQEHVQELIA
jgi:hypothetical protein